MVECEARDFVPDSRHAALSQGSCLRINGVRGDSSLGKEEEGPTGKEILRHLKDGGIDLTGKTRLLQLAALLERCQLLVTNDTGTMHIATAVGTPVVALFGSTDPSITGPWGDGHVVIKKDVPCSPCLKRICPTDRQCMTLITVDEVEEVVDRKLRELHYKR